MRQSIPAVAKLREFAIFSRKWKKAPGGDELPRGQAEKEGKCPIPRLALVEVISLQKDKIQVKLKLEQLVQQAHGKSWKLQGSYR